MNKILSDKPVSITVFLFTFLTGLIVVFLSWKTLNLARIPQIFQQAPCDPNDPCCMDLTTVPVLDPCYCKNHIRCVQLAPADLSPERGEQATFTCDGESLGVATIDHFEFRVNVDGREGQINNVSSSGNSAQFNYTVPQTGSTFAVQCRVCGPNGRCSVWGTTDQIRIPVT